MENEKPSHEPEPLEFACPNCEGKEVSTQYEERTFTHRDGEQNAVQISVVIPVRHCRSCKFTFTDVEAEELEHDAVCRHLRVMTPSQVVKLREKYDLSRAEFARITRLGEASLGRWERGAMIQNGASDQLLYLLRVPTNLELLRNRFKRASAATPSDDLLKRPTFRSIERTKSLCADAEAFELRRSRS